MLPGLTLVNVRTNLVGESALVNAPGRYPQTRFTNPLNPTSSLHLSSSPDHP